MKKIVLILAILGSINFSSFQVIHAQSEGEVGVTASVTGCAFEIIIKPEKRIPREGNFSNQNLIIFYDQFYQELFRLTDVQTDNNGYANIDLCEKGLSTNPGIYSIYVKGFSHLGKLYTERKGFFNYSTFFDLAQNPDDYLLAGDTIDHDYVNGLDLNTAISKLYTNDTKSDFNKDGIVNSLDLSNQLYNLHRSGQMHL